MTEPTVEFDGGGMWPFTTVRDTCPSCGSVATDYMEKCLIEVEDDLCVNAWFSCVCGKEWKRELSMSISIGERIMVNT